MAALSNYAEDKLLNHLLGVATFAQPSALYVGVFTAAPGEGGGGTEVSGGGYARVAVTFGAASGGASLSSGAVQFPKATDNWGIVTHFAIFDALTGGNMLLYGQLTESVEVTTNDILIIPAEGIEVTAD